MKVGKQKQKKKGTMLYDGDSMKIVQISLSLSFRKRHTAVSHYSYTKMERTTI